MYLCGCCEGVVRGTRQVHVVYREVDGVPRLLNGRLVTPKRKEVKREVPICGSCKSALDNGVDLVKLQRECRLRRQREEEDKRLAREEEKNLEALERLNQKVRSRPQPQPTFTGEVVKYKDLKNKGKGEVREP